MSKNELRYRIEIGNPLPLGATKVIGGINFVLYASLNGDEKCSLILYKKGTTTIATEILFTNEMKFGNVYAMVVKELKFADYDYNFRIGSKIITDPYAELVNTTSDFGYMNKREKTSGFYVDHFNWEDDMHPDIPFCESFIYRLHVRGFTKGKYSGVKKKGTFLGILEKLDYLKKLGVTMIELMPAYDFNEVIDETFPFFETRKKDKKRENDKKVDFWGYRDADYFMPKVSFSSKKTPKGAILEFKQLVRELHKNNIEICMEFHFMKDVLPTYIIDCFRFWVLNYHIDGIHCNLSDECMEVIKSDPYLARTKLISYGFSNDYTCNQKHLGEFNEAFMNVARRFLKGDEGQVKDMAYRIRYNKTYAAPINYLASNNTFTLMDTVSYSCKHNLINNEMNMDGSDYNNSWNCGVEGITKKKSINQLRIQQIKNALCLLLLSQGTPMIYAGDEFGNSCNGNNNPYCQDNEISYLDWRMVQKNNEIFSFFCMLMSFRKNHKILHLENVMQGKDYRAFGMPDISFHSEKTWILGEESIARHFGVMYYGKYCSISHNQTEENIYVAYNMHWEQKHLGLPTPGKNKKWTMAFMTANSENNIDESMINRTRMLPIPPRCVIILISSQNNK